MPARSALAVVREREDSAGEDTTVRQIVAEEIARALRELLTARELDMVPPQDGMNAEEVAVFLGVDRKTVYEYANRGKIPHQRLGKRLLFSRQALVAWLGACKAASARHRER